MIGHGDTQKIGAVNLNWDSLFSLQQYLETKTKKMLVNSFFLDKAGSFFGEYLNRIGLIGKLLLGKV